MEKFNLILDENLREVVFEFYKTLNMKIKNDNKILLFTLLEKEFLKEDSPNEYPQYIVITKDRIDKSVVDDIFYNLQDKYGWPYGHYFVNSYSRKNIFSIDELQKGIRVEGVYLDVKDVDIILNGKNIVLFKDDEYDLENLIQNAFVNLKSSIVKTMAKLKINEINDTIHKFCEIESNGELKNLIHVVKNEFCRQRGKGKTYETSILNSIKKDINEYILGCKDVSNQLVYGRLNASGKSQCMYNLMGFLFHKEYPFIFRESFYFHYKEYLKETCKGKFEYYNILDEKDNDNIDETTWWISKIASNIEDKTGKKPVILIDEDEVDFDELKDYLIIYGDKDCRIQKNNPNWKIHDIVKDDDINKDYVKKALQSELSNLELHKIIPNLNEIIDKICDISYLPLYTEKHYSVYWSKRVFSLVLVESIKRYLKDEKLCVKIQDVEKWGNYYWSKFVPKPGAVKEFHCEYIVYDGTNIDYDPYVEFNPEKLVLIND
ncbi:hypothetical protein ACFIJ5_09300 [Haloimpatiens sp. FM7330]|uniref:hypothetical protein n=1 Tax=Haloimpatiens sp. FM7330 TaxID=3298610 RepID=UPI0036300DF4